MVLRMRFPVSWSIYSMDGLTRVCLQLSEFTCPSRVHAEPALHNLILIFFNCLFFSVSPSNGALKASFGNAFTSDTFSAFSRTVWLLFRPLLPFIFPLILSSQRRLSPHPLPFRLSRRFTRFFSSLRCTFSTCPSPPPLISTFFSSTFSHTFSLPAAFLQQSFHSSHFPSVCQPTTEHTTIQCCRCVWVWVCVSVCLFVRAYSCNLETQTHSCPSFCFWLLSKPGMDWSIVAGTTAPSTSRPFHSSAVFFFYVCAHECVCVCERESDFWITCCRSLGRGPNFDSFSDLGIVSLFAEGNSGQDSSSSNFALPLWHQEQGRAGTVLGHLCALQCTDISTEIITSMQHCKLEAVICGLEQRETVSTNGLTSQGVLLHQVLFHYIWRHVALLWCHVPHHSSNVTWWTDFIEVKQQKKKTCWYEPLYLGSFLKNSFPKFLKLWEPSETGPGREATTFLLWRECSPLQHWTPLWNAVNRSL